MRTPSLAIAALVLASACLPVPSRGGVGVPERGRFPRSPADTAGTRGMSQKVVQGKESPTTLIAIDGARCTVTEKKFNETQYGDRVWCVWR